MKNIKIKSLTVSNWRNQNFSDTYGMNENRVSGMNGSGKSTRIAAWNWLLSGYTDANSPLNSKLFDDKIEVTKDTPTASVKAVIAIDDEEYTLERVAIASFTRKRGTDTWIKSPSDTYKYFIDNIERNASDYKDWLTLNIASEDMLRFVLTGEYFINAVYDDKKRARAIIEKIIGEVKREEMKGDYALIDELLEKYTPDEVEQQAANLAKGIGQRLDEIPVLIQNAEREVSDIMQTDFVANDREITRLEGEREDCEKQLLDLTERVKPQMEARAKAIADKQMKREVLDKAYSEWKREPIKQMEILGNEIAEIKRQNEKSKGIRKETEAKRDRATDERDRAIRDLQLAELKRERLLAERDTEKSATIDPTEKFCPNCGAELTGDKLQEVLDRFEKVKREKIDRIVSEGKATATEIERLNKIIEEAQNIIDAPLPEVAEQSTIELERRVAELSATDTSINVFLTTEYGQKLNADIDTIVIPEVSMPDVKDIKEKKAQINRDLVPLYETRGLKQRIDKLNTQIETLRAEQREKGAELAKYERMRQLCKDYKQEQMEILSRKVNEGLRFSRIEVWSKQKDGTVVPDLVIKDSHGVSFSTTNNAARITTCVDIQRFFCDMLGVNMPCFVDEVSILDSTNLPVIDGVQMFYLFCSETSLKIESK